MENFDDAVEALLTQAGMSGWNAPAVILSRDKGRAKLAFLDPSESQYQMQRVVSDVIPKYMRSLSATSALLALPIVDADDHDRTSWMFVLGWQDGIRWKWSEDPGGPLLIFYGDLPDSDTPAGEFIQTFACAVQSVYTTHSAAA